jgi:3-isopropylmalate/(R)-2-methylmalate dehydratase small subunit
MKGKAWKFGDNINTDEIIPARYLNTSDPVELARHCMEDADPEFSKKISAGDILVGGKNFGCGSSREHAPIAVKAAGLSCVIAKSFARIFFRNAYNMGLMILESAEASEKISTGDAVEIDLNKGKIINHTKNQTYTIRPIPQFMQELVSAGGLLDYIKNKLD